MDCRHFRQAWEPKVNLPWAGRLQKHVRRCAACRQWQAEQTATDNWLRAALHPVIAVPLTPQLRERLRPMIPPAQAETSSVEPRWPLSWHGLPGRLGYALASLVTAAALLAAALQPPLP